MQVHYVLKCPRPPTRDICRLSSVAVRILPAVSKLSVTARSSEFGGAWTTARVTCTAKCADRVGRCHCTLEFGRSAGAGWLDHLALRMPAPVPRLLHIGDGRSAHAPGGIQACGTAVGAASAAAMGRLVLWDSQGTCCQRITARCDAMRETTTHPASIPCDRSCAAIRRPLLRSRQRRVSTSGPYAPILTVDRNSWSLRQLNTPSEL